MAQLLYIVGKLHSVGYTAVIFPLEKKFNESFGKKFRHYLEIMISVEENTGNVCWFKHVKHLV